MTIKRFFTGAFKITIYLLVVFLVLVISSFIYINTQSGKRFIRLQLQSYLQKKLSVNVTIAAIDFSFPKWISLKGIYLEDRHKDTLIYGELVAVDIKMLKLINGNIDIANLNFKNIYANINRSAKDSFFNYQFIIDAFAGNSNKPKQLPDTASLKINLQKLFLNNVQLKFSDKYGGNEINTYVKKLEAKLDQFQPDKMRFDIAKLSVDGIDFSMTTTSNSIKTNHVDTTVFDLFFKANNIDIRNVNLIYQNKVDGMFYHNKIGQFSLTKIDLNLANQKAFFGDIFLSNSYIQYTDPVKKIATIIDTSTVSNKWNVAVNKVQLINDQIYYDEHKIAAKEGLDLAHLRLTNINAWVNKIVYHGDSILAAINQLAFKDRNGFIVDSTHADIRYTNKGIEVDGLYIGTPQTVLQSKLIFKYDDIKNITIAPQNSELSMSLNNSIIAVNDLYLLMPFVKKYLPEQQFKNSVIKLSTVIDGTLLRLNIPSLQMAALDGSVLNAKAILYNVTNPSTLAYDIAVFNSSILKSDLVKYFPAYTDKIKNLPGVINYGTHLKGNLKNTVADISINSSILRFAGKAAIKNLDRPSALQYNIFIAESKMEKNLLIALLPPGTIPTTINLPEIIMVSGTAKGDMNNILPNLLLNGSYGMARVTGFVHQFKQSDLASYNFSFQTKNFQIGKLIKQDSLVGNLSFSGTAIGKGFNYKTMETSMKANIESIGLKQYNYQNILLTANFKNGDIESTGKIDDPNIKLAYSAAANLRENYPSLEATIRVDTIQLQPLHFYKDTLNASFTAFVKAADLDPEKIDFYALVDSSKININNHFYVLDSIVAAAKNTNGINAVYLKSQLADIAATGKFQYDKIGSSLLQFIDKYFNITDSVKGNIPPQQISFEGVIKKDPLMASLIYGLDYGTIPFSGSFASNATDSALQLKLTMPYLQYLGNRISNVNVDLASSNDKLSAFVNSDTVQFGTNILYKTSVNAVAAANDLHISAITKDQKNLDRYAIGTSIAFNRNGYGFSLSDTLLLNYKKWLVARDNLVQYSPDGILIKNLFISNDSSRISASSIQQNLNSPIDVSIDNFKIRDITSMINSDTLLASGIIDAKFTIGEFDKKLPAFTGHIQVDSLQFMQQPVGTIKLFTERVGENIITANMGLTGNGNDLAVKGNYYLNDDARQFDVDLDINHLNLSTLQAFSGGNLVRSSGSFNGKLIVDGTFAAPHWNGAINFDSSHFSLAKFGTSYAIDHQKISFNYPVISFANFTVKDSLNNMMVVNGAITSKSISEYDLDMGITANNFTLVNVAKAIGNQIYGVASVDAEVTVKGNSTSPEIEGNIALNDKSDVTLVLPETNVNKDAAKSVVRFIDRDTFELPEKIKFRPVNEVKPAFAQFLNYNLNIEVTKQASLTVIIDPGTGDELKIQGDAQLNAGIDPGGNILLAGHYELNSGYYILNFQFLRKKFNLLPGSTIAFSGTPTDAQIDIKAEYIANTSAKDLLGNEIGSVDPKLANMFKQEIPFKVILNLKGAMMKPEISFDIEMPDEKIQMSSDLRTTIENKLAQLRGDIAATNKQVFSLLLFNRFVGEQSTDFFKTSGSGDGSGFNDIARQSVSKFLSAALDNIASDLFKGLDVDLNLNSYKDYSSGDAQQKTDLNVAVSKSFINDRLSISVGKNFGIEGQDALVKASRAKGSGFLPDVTLNYKLTQDGKYMIRAYKKTQFEVILDGYIIETGLAFIITMNFDKFNELFKKKTK